MPEELTLLPVTQDMKPLTAQLAIGEDATLEAQLVGKSLQPNIVAFTPNDSEKRFVSIESLHHWLAKGRELHWLLAPNNDLAGIIWYGKSAFPFELDLDEPPQETFAIRLYDGYNGHGLARPFMQLSLRAYVARKQELGEPITGIWLQTNLTNQAAIAAYTKFGYQEVARDDKRVTMILSSGDIADIVGS